MSSHFRPTKAEAHLTPVRGRGRIQGGTLGLSYLMPSLPHPNDSSDIKSINLKCHPPPFPPSLILLPKVISSPLNLQSTYATGLFPRPVIVTAFLPVHFSCLISDLSICFQKQIKSFRFCSVKIL